MIDNQIARRNISDGWKWDLIQTKKELLAAKGRENMIRGGEVTDEVLKKTSQGLSTIDKPCEVPHNTRDELAKDLGWSTGKVAMVDKVWKQADPEVKEKIKAGEVSINQAYQNIKKEEKKEERKKDKKYKIMNMPDGVFRVIYADPPWKYNDKCEEGAIQSGGAEKHYPTMSITELCNMELPKIADDAVLFLWTTSPLLEESFAVIKAWGFKYKASFVWDKIKHNMGHYNSVRHEFLLICTKGSCTPDNLKLFDSVQSIEKTDKHSQKPHEFREIIKTLYPTGNAIELFAREKHDGWESWGNEI